MSTFNRTKAEPNRSPRCHHCGSERIFRDAWAVWDIDSQQWSFEFVQTTFDAAFCEPCDGETKIIWLNDDQCVGLWGKITEEEK